MAGQKIKQGLMREITPRGACDSNGKDNAQITPGAAWAICGLDVGGLGFRDIGQSIYIYTYTYIWSPSQRERERERV